MTIESRGYYGKIFHINLTNEMIRWKSNSFSTNLICIHSMVFTLSASFADTI